MQSKTGALEGPEVDGFVKDMMELVKVKYHEYTDVTLPDTLSQTLMDQMNYRPESNQELS